MKKLGRPSPAMVVACLALIVGLGGTAVAGGVLTAKKSKKIANTQISKKAPTLSVKSAKTADSATTATTATTAGKADNVFWAKVDYGAVVTNVTSSSGGISGNGESFLGAPRLVFPRDMTNCAVTANANNGGGNDAYVRQSTLSAGTQVVLAMVNAAGTDVRSNFNVIAVC